MPGIKPADFLRDVRRRFPHVVVIVITGYGSIEGAVEATKMGAFDYLTKPIVDDEIRVIVEKGGSPAGAACLRTRRCASSSICGSGWKMWWGTTRGC